MIRSILLPLLFVSTAFAALPPAAADLKAKRDAKVAEIDRVYAAELDKIQRRLMADGNLQAANEIQKEIEKVTKDPFKTNEPSVVGKWKMKNAANRWLKREFTPTHLIDENGDKHPYELKDGFVIVTWSPGSWEKLRVDSASPNSLKGSNDSGQSLVYERL